MTRKQKDLSSFKNRTFGRWVVKGVDDQYPYLICECKCKTVKRVRLDSLLKGGSESCGCLSKERLSKRMATRGGRSKHPLHQRYFDMVRRCTDPERKDYHLYGGRGITVCERWLDYENGFNNFLEDMEESYTDSMELERVDNDSNYCKDNCMWVSRKMQTNNTGKNLYLEYKGYNLSASDWSHLMGINPARTIVDRKWKLKWSDKKALEEDVKKKNRILVSREGFALNSGDWIRHYYPNCSNPCNILKSRYERSLEVFCQRHELTLLENIQPSGIKRAITFLETGEGLSDAHSILLRERILHQREGEKV